MQDNNLETIIKAYFEAFEQRDLARCVEFYAEDARIDFVRGIFQGMQDIEQWHKDRFKADVEVSRIDEIKLDGETVTVDMVGTSKVARAWKLNKVAGRGAFTFDQGKIKDVKFSLRMAIPVELW